MWVSVLSSKFYTAELSIISSKSTFVFSDKQPKTKKTKKTDLPFAVNCPVDLFSQDWKCELFYIILTITIKSDKRLFQWKVKLLTRCQCLGFVKGDVSGNWSFSVRTWHGVKPGGFLFNCWWNLHLCYLKSPSSPASVSTLAFTLLVQETLISSSLQAKKNQSCGYKLRSWERTQCLRVHLFKLYLCLQAWKHSKVPCIHFTTLP